MKSTGEEVPSALARRSEPSAHPVESLEGTAYSSRVIAGILGLFDVLIVVLAGMGVYVTYVGFGEETLGIYTTAIVVNVVLTVGSFYIFRLYSFEAIADPNRQIPKIFGVCGTIFLLLVSTAFTLKISTEFSRVWSFSSFLIETLLIYESRAYFHFLIHKWSREGKLTRRIAIIGAGDQGQRLSSILNSGAEPWIRVVGIYDDRTDRLPEDKLAYPVNGTIDDLIERVRRERIDDILLALPWTAEDRLWEIAGRLQVLPVNIYISPDMIGLRFHNRSFERIGEASCLSVFEKPISDWNYVLKLVEDYTLGMIALILILPLLACIAVAVKLDSPGPVLFRQKRYGFNNEVFDVFKFRTMYANRLPEEGIPQATKNDPRVTRVGGLLRRTRLDELPQLFNVLNGTMSLVGPRPHAIEHNEQYDALIRGYSARHRVKPGITGWAQVNGARGETDTPEKMTERIRYDSYYIDNWSLFLDFRILLMTFYVVLSQENAY